MDGEWARLTTCRGSQQAPFHSRLPINRVNTQGRYQRILPGGLRDPRPTRGIVSRVSESSAGHRWGFARRPRVSWFGSQRTALPGDSRRRVPGPLERLPLEGRQQRAGMARHRDRRRRHARARVAARGDGGDQAQRQPERLATARRRRRALNGHGRWNRRVAAQTVRFPDAHARVATRAPDGWPVGYTNGHGALHIRAGPGRAPGAPRAPTSRARRTRRLPNRLRPPRPRQRPQGTCRRATRTSCHPSSPG
jgi:hypothetical protein